MYKIHDYLGLAPSPELSEEEKNKYRETFAKLRKEMADKRVAVILASAQYPGRKVLYSVDHPDGLLLPEDYNDDVLIWSKPVSRETNNELAKLPGFFFHPSDTEGLEELTLEQRMELTLRQGVTSIDPVDLNNPDDRADTEDALENGRIPTHRRPGTKIPSFGKVPMDLREVIQVRGV